MGRASGATALLAFAGLWTLCCVFVFGRFLGGEQPLDPRSHRARPDASEDTAQRLGSSGRLSSGTQHGAGARQEVDAFTGHDTFAERRHSGGKAGPVLPLSESRRAKPYGDEDVPDANGAMRVFAGHAAFDAAKRSAKRSDERAGREMRDIDRGAAHELERDRRSAFADVSKASEASVESAPAFDASEVDGARGALDDADVADDPDPMVIREQDISASLAAVARRVVEREAGQETETLEQQVARLKDEALGRKGGALG